MNEPDVPGTTLRAAQAEALRAAANLKTTPRPAPDYEAGLYAAQALADLRDAIRARAAEIEAGA